MTNGWKFIISATASLLTLLPPALAADLSSYLLQPRTAKPVELRRAPTLEEMIIRGSYPAIPLQPIPLHGVNINGLQSKSVDTLGFNYFIVIDNTKYTKMSDVYREARLAGKSVFVTTDSIVHPYIAFTNRVLADLVVKSITPDLQALLTSMQSVSLEDYAAADDAEVREDIAHNIAYLAVALKLLNPAYQTPKAGRAPQLVEQDLKSMLAGDNTESAIFNRREDFACFHPIGWYNSAPVLQNYYRCRQWLSHLPYPINDVSNGEEGRATNNFRRSVLLFRSLDRADVLGKPAMDVWSRIVKTNGLLGSQVEGWHERTLYPPDYKLVFQDRPADLKVMLAALAEPLYRTKLMLAIRRQKPMNLSATSIFELDDSSSESANSSNFKLFPEVGQPETRWFQRVANTFPSDKEAASSWPLGLLDMYIWGSPQAGNALADMMWTLDPNIAKVLPDLQHCILKRGPAGQRMAVESRTWSLINPYFRPGADTAASALRCDLWGNRKLVSAMGAWVDSMACIAPAAEPTANKGALGEGAIAAPAPATTGTEAATADGLTQSAASAPPRRSKVPPYHYLDPSVSIYKQLESDAQKMQVDLQSAHFLPDQYKQRFGDFIRLFQRLQRIAETELNGSQLNAMDKRLLGSIDQILDKVDVPLPSVVTFAGTKNPTRPGAKDESPATAINMAVGRPGLLYIIYQNSHSMEWTLGRGAVYTYYEMGSTPLTEGMWQHRIDAGYAKPPSWTQRYEIVQQTVEKTGQTAASSSNAH